MSSVLCTGSAYKHQQLVCVLSFVKLFHHVVVTFGCVLTDHNASWLFRCTLEIFLLTQLLTYIRAQHITKQEVTVSTHSRQTNMFIICLLVRFWAVVCHYQKFLTVLPHNLDTAAHRFSVAAPRLWNSLPLNCRTAPSVNTFMTRLKTFLFASA